MPLRLLGLRSPIALGSSSGIKDVHQSFHEYLQHPGNPARNRQTRSGPKLEGLFLGKLRLVSKSPETRSQGCTYWDSTACSATQHGAEEMHVSVNRTSVQLKISTAILRFSSWLARLFFAMSLSHALPLSLSPSPLLPTSVTLGVELLCVSSHPFSSPPPARSSVLVPGMPVPREAHSRESGPTLISLQRVSLSTHPGLPAARSPRRLPPSVPESPQRVPTGDSRVSLECPPLENPAEMRRVCQGLSPPSDRMAPTPGSCRVAIAVMLSRFLAHRLVSGDVKCQLQANLVSLAVLRRMTLAILRRHTNGIKMDLHYWRRRV